MYNPGNAHFIFRQSTGEILDFYHSERFGLCYSSLTKKNIWTNPVSVNKSTFSSFYAEMDSEDRFHILFQDLQGNLHYVLMDGSSIKTIPVLASRTATIYDKHLHLIPVKDEVHFFYVLKQEKSPILSHQILGSGKGGNPRVVDYVYENAYPAALIYDGNNAIHAFYQTSDGKYLQLGEKAYDTTLKRWGDFISLTEHNGDCLYPKTVLDGEGTMHLCYQKTTAGQYELVYRQKKPDSLQWSGEIPIHSSIHTFENASIMWLNSSIIIYWLRDGVIYCRIGYQSGNSWGKSYRYNFPYKGEILCLRYKTNFADEAGKTAVFNIPGTLTGGLKLAFYKFIPNSGETMSVENIRDLIMESFRLLRDSTDELREETGRIHDELIMLRSRQAEMEKELIGLQIKSNEGNNM